MKLEFIANACQIFHSHGKKLLCDPWLTEGAFEGSWYHWPPLETTPDDVSDYDYLYISHIDPDHFDPETLKFFDKTKPVIILKFKHDFLGRKIRELGFTNIVEVESEKHVQMGPFKLTLFGPFQGTRLGDECVIGNVIDSAILVEADGHRVLNTVDNLPSCVAARFLQKEYGPFTLVQLNYNSAGPYPDCWIGWSEAKKKLKADLFQGKQLDRVNSLAFEFEGAAIMPFAGDYVLVGAEAEKNFYNATCSPEYAKLYLEELYMHPAVITMKEGQVLDLSSSLRVAPTHSVRDHERYLYGLSTYATYPHEEKIATIPSTEELRVACLRAYDTLLKYVDRFQFKDQTAIIIESGLFSVTFDFFRRWIGFGKDPVAAPYILFRVDPRLLWRMLHGQAHWNNAEIGAHISIKREPDIYKQDIHMLMNFFHV